MGPLYIVVLLGMGCATIFHPTCVLNIFGLKDGGKDSSVGKSSASQSEDLG